MKKMNILLILITSILIFGTTNVSAETCNGKYDSSLSQLNLVNRTANLGTNQFNFDLNNIGFPSNLTDANEIRGQLYWLITKTNDSITSNINLTETCTSHTDYGTTYGNNGRIVYADGTTAQIDYSQRTFLCNGWSENGSMSYTENYEPEITNVFMTIRDNTGNNNTCNVTSNGYFTCTLKNGVTSFDRISIYLVLSKYNSVSVRFGLLYNNLIFCKTDGNSIVNSITQNTNTINNSIQDTKDTITSNTIDSNTNTDNLITIPNSNGKNTILDLLMVPINFVTSIINSFSNSCVSYNLGSLLGTDLILPCINLQNILGSGLYNIIDAIFAFGMIFAFIRSIKKFIQKSLLLASDVSSEVSIF